MGRKLRLSQECAPRAVFPSSLGSAGWCSAPAQHSIYLRSSDKMFDYEIDFALECSPAADRARLTKILSNLSLEDLEKVNEDIRFAVTRFNYYRTETHRLRWRSGSRCPGGRHQSGDHSSLREGGGVLSPAYSDDVPSSWSLCSPSSSFYILVVVESRKNGRLF